VKLVLVIGTLERGGTERQLVELVRAVHPKRAECVVICLGAEGPLAAEVRQAGARVVSAGTRRLYDPRTCWRLARILRAERPEVVYAFLFWGYGVALPIARAAVPGACRIQGRRSLPQEDRPSRRTFEVLRWLADRYAHGVIANSTAVGAAVAAYEPGLAGRIWVVPNGVSVRPTSARSPGATTTLICVANLIDYKGHSTLLEAVARITRRDWRLWLVGDGPERSSLEQQVQTLDLAQHITFWGRRTDVDALLAQADIAVLPSYSEGLPNAVMEAMAHGLPVVASDVGGVIELLGSGAGLLVPPREPGHLAGAVQRLLDDPTLRARLGSRGREIVEERLAVETMASGVLSAIADICVQRQSVGRGPV
jgi:L-malate glycosyltransferase